MTTAPSPSTRVGEARQAFIGKDINDLPRPAAVLDVARARRHCAAALTAAEKLGVEFRQHIKTHKTIELSRLQVGETTPNVKLVVSTVAELAHILPWLKDLRAAGRTVNVLYGIPLPPSQVPRLATLARELGPDSITFMIDHPSQLGPVQRFHAAAGFSAGVFLKVDTGYHRAGLPPHALNKGGLVTQLAALEAAGEAHLVGLYSHSSLSYNDATADEAMDNLIGEIEGCVAAVHEVRAHLPPGTALTISVGASPQVTSIQNLTASSASSAAASKLSQTIQRLATPIDGIAVQLELHAGVYSVLDLQQLATHSRVETGSFDDEIALSVLAEVVSVYNDGERGQPEALVAAGVLALGREPCQGYSGWGVVSPRSHAGLQKSGAGKDRRLMVGRISQEHGVLLWDTAGDEAGAGGLPQIPLEVGDSVRIYPNHACITGAMYPYYFVVDSSDPSKGAQVVDVWERASGW